MQKRSLMNWSDIRMNSILAEIIKRTESILVQRKERVSFEALKIKCRGLSLGNAFKKAVTKRDEVNIVAEYKKASPSAGAIAEPDLVATGKQYEACGAAAISVLTEEDHFKGSMQDLLDIKKAVGIPVLRKDFMIDLYQVYESAAAGADAILLIAAVLDKTRIEEFSEAAGSLGLDVIVEVHSQEELDMVLSLNVSIIGINNRNLDTFAVDVTCAERLASSVPEGTIVIAESGYRTPDDIARLTGSRIDAVLIGEAFMRSPDPGALLRDMVRAGKKNSV